MEENEEKNVTIRFLFITYTSNSENFFTKHSDTKVCFASEYKPMCLKSLPSFLGEGRAVENGLTEYNTSF